MHQLENVVFMLYYADPAAPKILKMQSAKVPNAYATLTCTNAKLPLNIVL
jgi:hypothetical protein